VGERCTTALNGYVAKALTVKYHTGHSCMACTKFVTLLSTEKNCHGCIELLVMEYHT